MMSKISQREARRLKKRVDELEREIDGQRRNWSNDWPGGVHIATAENEKANAEKIQVARKLGHAVVATDAGDRIEFRALPLPAKP
jgi:hypothetical protein